MKKKKRTFLTFINKFCFFCRIVELTLSQNSHKTSFSDNKVERKESKTSRCQHKMSECV